MPELPEVEVSRLGIAPHLEGCRISAVVVREKRFRWPVLDAICHAATQCIVKVSRRAKYLIIELEQGDQIILHLGMSGKLRIVDSHTPLVKHDHIDIVLTSGKCLRFNDPRRFGACIWHPAGEPTPTQLKGLGPEPLTQDFTSEQLIALSRGKQVAVKPFIMNNAVVVGVGNIYANEALFISGIDPRRKAGNVSAQRYEQLTSAIKQVLSRAIEQGGTTLKDFTQSDGSPGYFKQSLNVYGRAGEECLACNTPIKSLTIGQRNTFFCPTCQR